MDGTKVNSMTEPAIPCGSLFDAGSDLRRREPKACLRLKAFSTSKFDALYTVSRDANARYGLGLSSRRCRSCVEKSV
jgi:hypothetical protein